MSIYIASDNRWVTDNVRDVYTVVTCYYYWFFFYTISEICGTDAE